MRSNRADIPGYLLLILLVIVLTLSVEVSLYDFGKIRFSFPVLFADALHSFLRVTIIAVISWLLGIFGGYVMFHSKAIRSLFLPSVNFIRHISPFAWLPFAIVWFGLGEISLSFIMFITLFFPVLIAAADIFSNIDPDYIDESDVSGASRIQKLYFVELPLSIPQMINLFRIIWGLGWATIIAAEMLGVKSGLGFRLLDFRYLLQYPQMLIYLGIMGIIGIAVDGLIRRIHFKTKLFLFGT